MDTVKVFIIDRNQIARKMFMKLLSDVAWIKFVGEAGTGQGGVIMFDEFDPDIVFLDSDVAGGMTVEEVVREIRNVDSNIKVILIENFHPKDLEEHIAKFGVDNITKKPYQKINILRVIREAIS